MIRHIVFVRFASAVAEDRRTTIMADIERLRSTVPGVLSFTGGRNVSKEGRSAGFTHAFVMDFAGTAERDVYLGHLAHVAAATKLEQAADGDGGILVVDLDLRV